VPPTVAAEPVTAGTHVLPDETDYHALNAMLNLYDADARFSSTRTFSRRGSTSCSTSTRTTVFFHNQDEKLDYLIRENYYEREVLDQYSRNFVKELLDRAYARSSASQRFSARSSTTPLTR